MDFTFTLGAMTTRSHKDCEAGDGEVAVIDYRDNSEDRARRVKLDIVAQNVVRNPKKNVTFVRGGIISCLPT